MKTLLKLMASLLLVLTGSISFSQTEDIGSFLAAGPDDAQKLLEVYLSPYINAFGSSMTGGWYNTAKAHKPGGFDLLITLNTSIVPNKYRSFVVDELELVSLVRAAGTEESSPTIAGKNENGPQLNYNLPGLNQRAFDLPKGTNFPYIPTPMIQAGIGIIKETEIMGRFMPTVKYDGMKIGMWGLGLKHGLTQWLPFMKNVPILNIAIQGGFTRLNSSAALNVTPEDIGASNFDNNPAETWNDQKLTFQTNSFTGNLIVSADLPIVCFYGGLGFTTTKTNLKMTGNYPGVAITGTGPEVQPLVDPVDINIKNQDGGVTKPRLNLGIRFKFGLFMLNFDYTRSNYSVATAGLGITFR